MVLISTCLLRLCRGCRRWRRAPGRRQALDALEHLAGLPGLVVFGDCAEFKQARENHPSIEQLWYTGKMHGETVANSICGNMTIYNRGIWFNSAKFIDIEYQSYGMMFSQLPSDQGSFYWEHSEGRKSFRMNFNKSDLSIIGFNFFGIRYKQSIADTFIRDKKDIYFVMQHINLGMFDPEFSKNHLKEIKKSFNQVYQKEIIISQ